MIALKYFSLSLILVSCSILVIGQEPLIFPKISVEVISAISTDSKRHFHYNTNTGVYYETRIGYRINKFFEVNLFVGYQLRNYLYYAEKSGNQVALIMDRHYVPFGFNSRLYLSDFFYEKMNLWKKKKKWDVYIQLGAMQLRGKDINDDRDEFYKNQGYVVPFYAYPYQIDYNHFYGQLTNGFQLE